MRKRFSAIVACGALLGLSLVPVAHAAAQSPSKVYRLDAKVDPAIPRAKIAAVEGVADRNGHRFELDHLTIRQPVLVVLRAMDPTHKVQLRLMKFTWGKAERSGLTDAEGFVSFLVKTENDFRILVNAAGPDARYSLFVLVGDEVMQPVPSIFVPMSRGEHQAPRIQPHMLHVPGPGWLSILFFPGLVLRKYDRHGRPRRTRALLLSVLAITTVLGGAALGAQKEPSGKGPSAIGFAEWMGKFIASGDFSRILDVTANAVDSWKNVEPLTKGDVSKQEDYDPAGAPQVPSHCAEAPSVVSVAPGTLETRSDPQGCKSCYVDSVARLNRVRVNLERLRALGQENKEFIEASIAFGDSLASIPNAGLGWYAAKREILEAQKGFNQIYDNKLREVLKSLEQSLRELSECEARYFNEKNWYERFGFVYYNFMAERYRRH